MRHIFIPLLFVFLTSSCSFIDRVLHGKVVARVGNSVLYQSDIAGLVPKGTAQDDSVAIVRQYINSWATKNLLLSNAESRLSREDRAIEQELNDYRTSLLVYRYEKLYVEKNLDTLISEQECKDYYEANRGVYLLPYSIVKVRYIKISNASPNYQQIKSIYRSTRLEDMDRVAQWCHNSADKFSDFNMDWIPLTYIAREMGDEISVCEAALDKKSYIEKVDKGVSYFVVVYDRIPPGEVTPYDYNINMIKESILSKRKQELIANLERNLLEDALNNNKLVIYSNSND